MSAKVHSFLVRLAYLIGLALFMWVALWRLTWVWSKPYPISTDGFFYLLEFREYARSLQGIYTSASPFFLSIGRLASFFRLSPPTTYYILISFNLFLVAAAPFVLTKKGTSGWRLLIILFISAAALFSDSLFFRIYAFPQQAFALGLLVLGYLLFVRDGLTILSLGLLALGAVSHLSAAAFAIIGSLFLLLCSQRVDLRVRAVLFFLGVLGLILLFFLAERPLFNTNFLDFHLPLAQACTFRGCTTKEWIETWVYLVSLPPLLLLGLRRQRVLLPLVGLMLLVNLPLWTSEGHMSYRLALTTPWLWYPACSLACTVVKDGRLISLGLIATLLSTGLFASPTDYREPGIPATVLEKLSPRLSELIPEGATVLTQHGMNFKLRYFLDRTTLSSTERQRKLPSPVYSLRPFRRGRRRCVDLTDLSQTEESLKPCYTLWGAWTLFGENS